MSARDLAFPLRSGHYPTCGKSPDAIPVHGISPRGGTFPMLSGVAHLIVRFRWLVIVSWLGLTLFGAFAASQLSSRWYTATAIPGEPAYEASQRSLHALGVVDRTPSVVVFHTDGDATKSPAIKQAMQRAADSMPGAFTSSYFTTNSLIYVSADRHTAFQMIYPAGRAAVDVLSGANGI